VATLLPATLLVSAALAWAPSVLLRGRYRLPLARVFVSLMAAVSAWCATSALHALVTTLAAKILVAKIQYVAICCVAPLWLMLTAEYAGVRWFHGNHGGTANTEGTEKSVCQKSGAPCPPRRGLRGYAIVASLWFIPVISMGVAATNDWHHAMWARIALVDGRAVYTHGWWFVVLLAFNYLNLLTGTVLLARTLRRSPPPFHAQVVALIVSAVVPWVGNILYVAQVLPAGFDPTPLAFTTSGLLYAWAIYRNHLFDLLPIARDMVVDGLSDAVFVLDPSRRILDLNAAARALVASRVHAAPRFAPTECVGETIDSVLPYVAATPLEATTTMAPAVVDDGWQQRQHEVRMMPLRARNGRLAAWVMLLRDVTAQRAAAAERAALRERVQEQQRRASLSILAGGLAHDFNNLLAGVIGNADLLAMQIPPSSEMGSSVGAILLGAQRAADLVDKMLAYAGERHGGMDRINLDALVRDLLDLLRASAGRHCTIRHKGQPADIVGDPTQVRQVIMNLIINAADAVDEGGEIHVTTGVERLTLAQMREMNFGDEAAPGRYAFFDVRDNGCGMSAETLRKIFDPFFTTKHHGHGLGLAAVQGIVIGHRGALRVTSDPSWGSRFRVWFPLAADDPALLDVPASAVGAAGSE
jgi:signal transduction histidine kinase